MAGREHRSVQGPGPGHRYARLLRPRRDRHAADRRDRSRRPALQQVAPKAEQQGVVIGLENTLSAEDNLRLLDRVGSTAVKVYYDVGNSTDRGRDVLKEIRALGKRICEFHFKDAGYMLGQGRIDFKAVRQALDEIHYSGWIQIEAAAPHGLGRRLHGGPQVPEAVVSAAGVGNVGGNRRESQALAPTPAGCAGGKGTAILRQFLLRGAPIV